MAATDDVQTQETSAHILDLVLVPDNATQGQIEKADEGDEVEDEQEQEHQQQLQQQQQQQQHQSKQELRHLRNSVEQRLAYYDWIIPIFQSTKRSAERRRATRQEDFALVWRATNDRWKATDEAKDYSRQHGLYIDETYRREVAAEEELRRALMLREQAMRQLRQMIVLQRERESEQGKES